MRRVLLAGASEVVASKAGASNVVLLLIDALGADEQASALRVTPGGVLLRW